MFIHRQIMGKRFSIKVELLFLEGIMMSLF